MSTFLHSLKRELWHALPPMIFFCFAFNIVMITNALSLMGHDIHIESLFIATATALVVGKVIPLADHLTFINKFPDRPLIYNIIWKTAIYIIVVFVARYVEHLIPFLIEDRGLMAANRNLLSEITWPRFWAIQIWLLVLFCMYATIVELVRALGKKRMIALFFTGGTNEGRITAHNDHGN